MTRTLLIPILALTLLTPLALAAVAREARPAAKPLAHMVFFTLKERNDRARLDLVALCEKHLSDHEGTLYFSVGTIAEDVVEPVSDREFDVALHLVFEGKEAADAYQKSERHQKFVAEGRDSWAKVRVFDSYLSAR